MDSTTCLVTGKLDVHPHARFFIAPRLLDMMPLTTFLIATSSRSEEATPLVAVRLVKPNDPSPYAEQKLTPDKRLLYYFWSHAEGAKQALGQASTTKRWRWIVQPGDPGFEELDAFKILCDHRRGRIVDTTLLYRALGLT